MDATQLLETVKAIFETAPFKFFLWTVFLLQVYFAYVACRKDLGHNRFVFTEFLGKSTQRFLIGQAVLAVLFLLGPGRTEFGHFYAGLLLLLLALMFSSISLRYDPDDPKTADKAQGIAPYVKENVYFLAPLIVMGVHPEGLPALLAYAYLALFCTVSWIILLARAIILFRRRRAAGFPM